VEAEIPPEWRGSPTLPFLWRFIPVKGGKQFPGPETWVAETQKSPPGWQGAMVGMDAGGH